MNQLRLLILFIGILFFSKGYSQVTIGSAKKPIDGALLMLDDGTTGGNNINAKAGLALTRVKLTDVNNLFPMFEKSDTDYKIGSTIYNKTTEDAIHTGLIVYNVNEDACLKLHQGLYVWDGTEWQGLIKNSIDASSQVLLWPDTRADLRPEFTGQTYTYRDFGSAGVWMTQNLNYLPADNSLGISTSTDSYETAAYIYPNGDILTPTTPPTTWTKEQGLLYTYVAATDGTRPPNAGNQAMDPNESKVQGICPPSWHIPTDYEYDLLEKELAAYPEKYSTIPSPSTNISDQVGEVMKAMCNPIPNQQNDTKAQGFSAIDGGFGALLVGIGYTGNASSFGEFGAIWSSSSYNSNDAWEREFYINDAMAHRYTFNRNTLLSVRCKKD